MKFAYADPPYIGQSAKHYSQHPDFAGEVDHEALIRKLTGFDAWALSCHTNSLGYLLSLCPNTVRIAAWVKPFAFFKKGVNPSYTWEPVIFNGARTDKQRRELNGGKHQKSIRDWVSANVWGCTAQQRSQSSVKGQKPPEFCTWLFDLIGLCYNDELFDLFPGSQAVSNEWDKWRKERVSVPEEANIEL